MISKTFKNLDEKRQEEILLAAFEEFSMRGYQSTSLSLLIKKLGLAKGSFYRYFSSKKDLYNFLIGEASKRRLTKLDKLITDPDINFFELIRQNFMDKVRFDMEHPVIGGFLHQVMHEKDTSEVADIIQELLDRVIEQTASILKMEKFRNQLRIADPEMVAFQIFHTQMWLYDYISYRYKINYKHNIKKRKPIVELTIQQQEEIIDKAVDMLRDGIGKKT